MDEKVAELVMTGLDMTGLDRNVRLERLLVRGDGIRLARRDTPAEADIPHAVRVMREERTRKLKPGSSVG